MQNNWREISAQLQHRRRAKNLSHTSTCSQLWWIAEGVADTQISYQYWYSWKGQYISILQFIKEEKNVKNSLKIAIVKIGVGSAWPQNIQLLSLDVMRNTLLHEIWWNMVTNNWSKYQRLIESNSVVDNWMKCQCRIGWNMTFNNCMKC